MALNSNRHKKNPSVKRPAPASPPHPTYAQIRESAVKHWPYLKSFTPVDLNEKMRTIRRMYSK